MAEKLVIISRLAFGDAVVMTGLIRDIHRTYPGKYLTWPVTSGHADVWANNPDVTMLKSAGSRVIKIHYAEEFRAANKNPMHFVEGYIHYFNSATGLSVKMTEKKPALYLTDEERENNFSDLPKPYWVLVAGGKSDMTTKWYAPEDYQAIVDQLRGQVLFVRVGKRNHYHPPLKGVVDLIGQTTVRQLMQLIYHSEGVVCPVTGAMHVAAALDKPAVVIAGSREPWQWEAYPNHTFLHTIGQFTCYGPGACYAQTPSRGKLCKDFQTLGPPEDPVKISSCMHSIRPEYVADAVRAYVDKTKHVYTGPNPVCVPRADPGPPMGRRFTLCTVMYGGAEGNETYPDKGERKLYKALHHNFLDGLIDTTDMSRVDLRIATNAVSDEILTRLKDMQAQYELKIYGPNDNRKKYPRMREMFYDKDTPIDTEWVVWLDDDVSFRYGNWVARLETFIADNPAARVWGEWYVYFLRPEMLRWHQSRPWWRGVQPKMRGKLARVDFVAGGFWAMRYADIVELDWPDSRRPDNPHGLLHNHGDVSLGSAMTQRGWKLGNAQKVVDEHCSATRGYRERPPTIV